MKSNLLLLIDSYKISQYHQYVPNTTHIYSYFESRGGIFNELPFELLQYILKEYMVGQAFTKEDIQEAYLYYKYHFGSDTIFNKDGWTKLYDKYNGKLPLKIKAVPEGTVVSPKNVLMTVENTDPEFYWLTNIMETLLVQVWYPITVAALSKEVKKIVNKYLLATSDNLDGLRFKLHDFGFRGSTSVESAAIGGAAHLSNFYGTDTVVALKMITDYYNTPIENRAGFSIPASEHSTISSWGKDNEEGAYQNMINQFGHMPMYACVSDTWDIYGACKNYWGGSLKEQILNQNGTLVIRPDSGYPPEVVLKVLNILGESFGYTTNSKGYKELPTSVRVIQGDGMSLIKNNTFEEILSTIQKAKWSTDMVAFGMGGGLLQSVDRDTCKFAFKCSNRTTDGVDIPVYKDPVTDPGKTSKKGKLKLVMSNFGEYSTVPITAPGKDIMETVFEDGELKKDYYWDEIRKRNSF